MNIKIALVVLFIVLFAATTVVTINAYSVEKPSTKRIIASLNEDTNNLILLGEPRGGGWPCSMDEV